MSEMDALAFTLRVEVASDFSARRSKPVRAMPSRGLGKARSSAGPAARGHEFLRQRREYHDPGDQRQFNGWARTGR